MRIDNDIKLDFSDVLIRPKRSTLNSRSEVDVYRKYTKFLHSTQEFGSVPIIAANMDTIGTFEMANALRKHNMNVALHKHYTEEELLDYFSKPTNETYNTFYSLGITEKDLEKYNNVKFGLTERHKDDHYPRIDKVCLDVANGYSQGFVDFLSKFREQNKDTIIMAGNVVTAEMTEALLYAGADIIKIGVGPGSACTTRVLTGIGYPQLSAIIECADAAHGLGGHICGDGGITRTGDLAKAFGGGADFVMVGGLFAGHEESGGELLEVDDNTFIKRFYGMSSKAAMKKHSGGVAKYRAAEGKCVDIPYRGPVETTALEMLGGLRSSCTYVGSKTLKSLSKRTTFIRVNNQENNIYGKE